MPYSHCDLNTDGQFTGPQHATSR